MFLFVGALQWHDIYKRLFCINQFICVPVSQSVTETIQSEINYGNSRKQTLSDGNIIVNL
jgi:hypothetical protein